MPTLRLLSALAEQIILPPSRKQVNKQSSPSRLLFTLLLLQVTSLESVVLQLQDSCREARTEAQELRQENNRLRNEFREREKLWRALWQARKAGQDVDSEELPPLPSSVANGLMGPLQINQYPSGGLAYRANEEASISYASGPSQYPTQPPFVSYSGETDLTGDGSSHSLGHRGQRYSPYPYGTQGLHRETTWPGPSTSSSDPAAAPNAHASRSPNFGSPIQPSTDVPFVGRFSVEDQKNPLSTLDTAPYVFPTSRSLSPATSTPSSSSASITTFPFTFPDVGGHDRTDLDYRRHSHPHGAEVTLHGGTADISLVGPASDAIRYRLTRPQLGSERPLLPSLPVPRSDNGSHHEQGSSDGDATPYSHARLHTRRATQSPSRSPSPGTPAISGTLAVIKAQAFGALRRTRARTKKSSEGAAKVAMNVLEARGIGMTVPGPNLKRQRIDDDGNITQS